MTGDIVFVLQQKEHPKFKRKYDDLFVEHTLSLTEALCGFQFALTHLDGRQLLIRSNPGEVIKPGMHSLPLFLISQEETFYYGTYANVPVTFLCKICLDEIYKFQHSVLIVYILSVFNLDWVCSDLHTGEK